MTATEKQNSDLLNEARYIANNIDGGSVDYAVEKILAFALKTSVEQNDKLLEALEAMMKAFKEVIPGIAHIVCKDYAIVNEAPILALAGHLSSKGEVTNG